MRRLVIGVVALALLVPAASARTIGHPPPAFGAADPNDPYNGDISGIVQLEKDTHRKVQVVNWFQQWAPTGSWTTQVHPGLFSAVTGRTPMLTWEPWDANGGSHQPNFTLAKLNSGIYDSYIRTFAQGLAGLTVTHHTRASIPLAQTVYLRLMHEMNGNWYPWSGPLNGANAATQYKQAWRRIVGIFRSAGASNVKFVWSPYTSDVGTNTGAEPNQMASYYPGDDVVDVMALDGYNWGDTNGGWLTFSQLFEQGYDTLKSLPSTDPIWIAEVGCAPDGAPLATSKAAWVSDMWAQANTPAWSRLKAISWFNFDGRTFGQRDWRANADLTVAAAFDPESPTSPPPSHRPVATSRPLLHKAPDPLPQIQGTSVWTPIRWTG